MLKNDINKDKSQAMKIVVDEYQSNFLEPELRLEFVEKIQKIEKEKFTKYKSVDDLEKDL